MLMSSIVQTITTGFFELLHLIDLVSFSPALHKWAMTGQCFASFKLLYRLFELATPIFPIQDPFQQSKCVLVLYTKMTQIPSQLEIHTDVYILPCRFTLPLLGTSRITVSCVSFVAANWMLPSDANSGSLAPKILAKLGGPYFKNKNGRCN